MCNGLQTAKHLDENYYCILHFPSSNKNKDEFSNAISNLIRNVDSKISEIEKLPEEEQETKKDKLKYDFRYVWFPCNFSLRGKKVKVEANFAFATFCEIADFMKTEFLGYANFDSVSFHKIAYFIFAKFPANAYFFSAKFLDEANFKYTFFSNGKFTNSVFSERADFESSEFVRHANFINVSFHKEINFKYSKLFIANFESAAFLRLTSFESVEFLESANFKGDKKNPVFGENAILDLQNAKFKNPESFGFHTEQLSPNWFINIDSRKFNFTNVHWKDIGENSIKENVRAELRSLENRGIKNAKALFKITCRQLAENAENNNRFEEASNFRKMAFEIEWIEKNKCFGIG